MALFTLDNPEHLPQLMAVLNGDDLLLLLGTATSLVFNSPEALDDCPAEVRALAEDLAALGIEPNSTPLSATYDDWVAFAVTHEQHVHWR